MKPIKIPAGREAELRKILGESRCTCGGKLTVTSSRFAALDVSCTRCPKGWHVPLMHRDQLPPPGHVFETADQYRQTPAYQCKACNTVIPRAQALRTFHELERALCGNCENKEIAQ
jgi:hypothetical protein